MTGKKITLVLDDFDADNYIRSIEWVVEEVRLKVPPNSLTILWLRTLNESLENARRYNHGTKGKRGQYRG